MTQTSKRFGLVETKGRDETTIRLLADTAKFLADTEQVAR